MPSSFQKVITQKEGSREKLGGSELNVLSSRV